MARKKELEALRRRNALAALRQDLWALMYTYHERPGRRALEVEVASLVRMLPTVWPLLGGGEWPEIWRSMWPPR